MKDLTLSVLGVAVAACLACAGSSEIPEPGSYGAESSAEAMEEEEEEATWRDANR
jgi:hypothetical protein